MVAGLLPATHVDIDLRVTEAVHERWTDQQMIHAQAGATVVAAAIGEVPVGVDALIGMKPADRVDPPLIEQRVVCRAALWKRDCIPGPALGDPGVEIGRDDIEVAAQHGRIAVVQQ